MIFASSFQYQMANTPNNHLRFVKGEIDEKQFKQRVDEMEEEESFSYALQLVTSTVLSMTVQSVTELGVFDIIAKAGSGP